MASADVQTKARATNDGRKLEYFTIAWNCAEAIVALVAGSSAGSVAMVGFGFDSLIEVVSGGALLWRMAIGHRNPKRKRREAIALKTVSWCLIALAIYIAAESCLNLHRKRVPETSVPGILLACASLVVMPWLSMRKKRVARDLRSEAMKADASQTQFSLYLSAILLGGLVLNAAMNWWWADALAGLAMVPFIAKEGIGNLKDS